MVKQQKEGLDVLCHSASHVMAQAVIELFPGTNLAIGPSIENGFYYDFDSSYRFTESDLGKIEARMKEIINKNYKFVRKEITKEEAKILFANNKYKLELINEIPDEKVTIYQQGPFIDLCKGPHVESVGEIKHFKLLSVAGAYWRGDEHREQLQRIYGTAFFTKTDLEEYLHKLEEAKKRDHRILGPQLELFSIHEEIGSGLIHWHPKGAIIRSIIEDYWRKEHLKHGYEIVYTPHIAYEGIYRTSGHIDKYKDLMYSPMNIDDRLYYIKPMNCPNHIMIYKTKLHSYRDLPIRYGEMGTVYRYEKAGVLHGLLRVRGFTIDDAHIFCTPEQIEQEIENIMDFTVTFLNRFGFKEFDIYLATRPENYVGEINSWEKAIACLRKTLDNRGYEYKVDEGGGAFYGPKIDLKIRDILGRAWQCTTIQFDFNLPQRFNVTYRDASGEDKCVIMIHRAILGSLERFLGVLIEHYSGLFPLWLAPVQAAVLSVSEKQNEYAETVYKELQAANLRVEINLKNQTLNHKIREATLQKVPYIVIVGEKERISNKIALRRHSGENLGQSSIANFLAYIKKELLQE